MLRFMILFATAWAVLLAWAMAQKPWWAEAGYETVVAAKVLALPVAAAWVTVEVMARLRRPRAMHAGVAASVRLVMSGLMSGIVSVLATAIVLAVVPAEGWDWIVVAITTAGTSACAVLFMPRVRAGSCVHCGYEVRDLARCPECGRVSAGRYIPGPA